MIRPALDINEIDDLEQPIGLYGSNGDGGTDMVFDVIVGIAVYVAAAPAMLD